MNDASLEQLKKLHSLIHQINPTMLDEWLKWADNDPTARMPGHGTFSHTLDVWIDAIVASPWVRS